MRVTTILARVLGLKQIEGFCGVPARDRRGRVWSSTWPRAPVCRSARAAASACPGGSRCLSEGRRWRHLDSGRHAALAPVHHPATAVPALRRHRGAGAVGRAAVLVHLRVRAARRLPRAACRQDDAQRHAAHWVRGTVGSIIERVVARLRPGDPPSTGCAVSASTSWKVTAVITEYVSSSSSTTSAALSSGRREGKDTRHAPRLLRRAGKAAVREAGSRHARPVGLPTSKAAVTEGLAGGPVDLRPVPRPAARPRRARHRAPSAVARGRPRGQASHQGHALRPAEKPLGDLTDVEQGKLTDVQKANLPLYRAYLLKETLARILDGAQVHVARDKLLDWMGWANRSRLPPFRRVARTIKQHIEGIVAYVATGLTPTRAPRGSMGRFEPSPDAASASIPPPASSPSSTCAAAALPSHQCSGEAHASTKPGGDRSKYDLRHRPSFRSRNAFAEKAECSSIRLACG